MTRDDDLVRRLRHALPLLTILASVYYVTAPALDSMLAPLDDSHVPFYLGADHYMSWGETFEVIRREGVTWGNRFIPLQLTLRMLEIKLRGFDARGWHVNRTAAAAVSACALYAALATVLRPAAATALTVFFLAGGQSEIWINLGFTETFGITLALLGIAYVALMLRRGTSRPLPLLPGFTLILLAAFVKEPFLPLAPTAILFVYLLLPRMPGAPAIADVRQWRAGDWVTIGLLALGMGIVIAGNTIVLRSHGHFYKSGLSAHSLRATAAFILGAFTRNWQWMLPPLAAVILLARRSGRRLGDVRAFTILLAVAVVCILLPQLLVYGSTTNLYERYLVPAVLAPILAAAAGFRTVQSRVTGQPGSFALAGIAVAMILLSYRPLRDARRNAAGFAEALRLFQQSVAEIISLKQRMPDAPIVFHAGFVWEWETIVAVSNFLSVSPISNQPRFLLVPNYTFDPADKKAVELAASLNKLSNEGGAGFSPLAELAVTEGNCVGVIFSGVKRPACRHIVLVKGDRY